MKIDLPNGVSFILDRLKENLHEAYIVGGCVRDNLMGITPHDWDIATSAKPEQVMELFDDCTVLKTGLEHGTITIMVDRESFEVTTYRIDGEYKDSRHPDSVEFVTDLKLDLMRRDFTINAMAYSPQEGLIDHFGGLRDIHSRIVRCVGNPDDRFQEDALRILRAIRFASRFGFVIETETYQSAIRNISLIKKISYERIQSEIIGITDCRSLFRQPATLLVAVVNELLPEFRGMEEDRIGRLIHLYDQKARLALMFKTENPKQTLKDLKFSNYMVDSIVDIQENGEWLLRESKSLCEYYDTSVFHSESDKADYIARVQMFGRKQDICQSILSYAIAMADDKSIDGLYAIERSIVMLGLRNRKAGCDIIRNMSNLAINGNDMKSLGYSGVEIGDILRKLLQIVLSGAVKNDRNDLMKIAKIMKDGIL